MKIAVITDTHYYPGTHEVNVETLMRIENEGNIDLLIHCGDVSSTNYLQQKRYWSLAREILDSKTNIIAVMGNHDWWDRYYDDEEIPSIRPSTCQELFSIMKDIYCEFDIHHASESLIYDNIAISGFDGWYSDLKTPKQYTNDKGRIPRYYFESESWLVDRNVKGFEKAINYLNQAKANGKKTILVTHFGFTPECVNDWKARENGRGYFGNNPRYSQFIENIDYLLYGHSHQKVDYMFNNTHVINTGSDYYNPKYKIMEV